MVGYVNADGLDTPVGVWRGTSSGTVGTMTPHVDWRGAYALGTWDDGSSKPCTGSAPKCSYIAWPAVGMSAARGHPLDVTLPSGYWMGSLLSEATDGSGMQYKRNRYYDPASGRFTQVDPIGLAGGLNAYGFGGGDQVNYSDPFGLCPPKTMAEVAICTGQLLQPVQRPLEAGGVLAIAPLAGEMGMIGDGITALGVAAREGISGTRLARVLGTAGEAASGLVKNTERIPSATGTAAFRVPDGLTGTTLSEVKNVAKLSLKNQLRDFSAFAQETGRSFELFVRQTTRLSGPLQQFIKDNGINLRVLK